MVDRVWFHVAIPGLLQPLLELKNLGVAVSASKPSRFTAWAFHLVSTLSHKSIVQVSKERNHLISEFIALLKHPNPS